MRLRGPMSAVVAGIVAVLLAALLVIAVEAAGGWRRVPPATLTAGGPAPAPLATPGLDSRGWRVRTVADLVQLAVVVALGLTPLGARFVHLVAPKGDTWHGAVAWLLILAAVGAVGRLPMLWWRRQMRQRRPDLFRPRGGPAQLLTRAAIIVISLLNLVLWIFVLILDVRGEEGDRAGVSAVFVVTALLLLAIRMMVIFRLPRSDHLSELLSSLPGSPRIRVVCGWPRVTATMGVISLLGRSVILVAPPVAAALTDRELTASMAHEVAHVQHRDTRRRVLRRLLLVWCVLAAVTALYGIPGLRALVGLHGRHSVQAGPFLLAAAYLVFRVLYAMELRAERAEERAADRDGVALSGDPDACAEGLAKLSSLLAVPDSWTLPQRLMYATHPATTERLRLIRDAVPAAGDAAADVPLTGVPVTGVPVTGVPVSRVRPRSATARRVRRGLLAGVLVLGALIAVGAASGHRAAITMPADAGKYRVLVPRSVDGSPLDTTSTDAVHLRSLVWGDGDLERFPGAVSVTAIYDQQGQSWLYVWGAYGKLADPSGELSAFWNKSDPIAQVLGSVTPDDESAGPRGGYLQCDGDTMTCAWADNSGIVAVSLSPPDDQSGVIVSQGAPITEQELAAMTLSLRATAEVPAQPQLAPSPEIPS
jgi:Zn-dependent protease with chaperone function